MTRNNIDKDTLFYADLETGEIIEVSMVKKIGTHILYKRCEHDMDKTYKEAAARLLKHNLTIFNSVNEYDNIKRLREAEIKRLEDILLIFD